MRIWGYIFIVLNIAAAGAFVYFATQVWQKRTEWQVALLKAELVNQGLPLEAPDQPPANLSDDSVALSMKVGEHPIDRVKKDILKKAIPAGGALGTTTEIITNQTAEVERLSKLVFAQLGELEPPGELEKIAKIEDPDEKKKALEDRKQRLATRQARLLLMLVNLSKGNGRIGAYALLRDLPIDTRYDRARHEIAYLGRTAPQVTTLSVLAAIGAIQESIERSFPPETTRERIFVARAAIARWLRSELENAVPNPYRSPNAPAPTADEPAAKNEDRNILEPVLRLLIDQEEDLADPIPEQPIRRADDAPALPPNPRKAAYYPKGLLYKKAVELKEEDEEKKAAEAKKVKDRLDKLSQDIDNVVKQLRERLVGDGGVTGAAAKAIAPIMADIAGNPLKDLNDLKEARTKLVELLDVRSTTESEKRANAALVAIMFSQRPYPQEGDARRVERERNIDTAGLESLRVWFEEASQKASSSGELPEDMAQAKSKLAALRTIRVAGQKRRDIAHLLYHIDADLGANKELRDRWINLMFPALTPRLADTLTEDEKEKALKNIEAELYKQRGEWHQRVAAIVGLETYVLTVEAQAIELAQMTHRLRPVIAEEQSFFEDERKDLILWIIQLSAQLDNREAAVKDQELLRAETLQELISRWNEQADLEAQHKASQKKAKAAITQLDARRKQLFTITQQLGAAQDALLGLEQQLREIELSRSNKK